LGAHVSERPTYCTFKVMLLIMKKESLQYPETIKIHPALLPTRYSCENLKSQVYANGLLFAFLRIEADRLCGVSEKPTVLMCTVIEFGSHGF